jgi:hypothetical protein
MKLRPVIIVTVGLLLAALGSLTPGAAGVAFAQAAETGIVRGSVVDSRDGAALARVSVRIDVRAATTDANGRFEIDGIVPGPHDLFVSAVDFLLVKRTVDVLSSGATDVTIALSAGGGTYTDSVTVVAADADAAENRPGQTLASRDLQQLTGLIASDPLRAMQVLPGVATGDDYRSDFAVRGLGSDHMNFTFEGVSSPFLVHTVQDVHDSGSVAMVNGDVLDEASLLSGPYAQRFGDRTGAELDFRMREGSRDRVRGRVEAGVTAASFVLEGPIRGSQGSQGSPGSQGSQGSPGSVGSQGSQDSRGSWLVSIRKSYIGAVVKRLSPETGFDFGFADAQAKLVYDVTPRQQVQFAITTGLSHTEEPTSETRVNEITAGQNATTLGVFTWRSVLSPRFAITQKFAGSINTFHNSGEEIAVRGNAGDALYRADWSYAVSPRLFVEGGGEARYSTASRTLDETFVDAASGLSFPVGADYLEKAAASTGAYALARIRVERGSVSPGVRLDWWALTGQTTASPWLQATWPLSASLRVRASAGVFAQEPQLLQVADAQRQASLERQLMTLRPERAYHAEAGLEGSFNRAVTWQATVYDREDRDGIRTDENEVALADGGIVSTFTGYRNTLAGYARGAEFVLQGRSPNGVSGWVSYALEFARDHDVETGETFWADYDQRHTVNAYGLYRVTDRLSLNARLRYGSNFPNPGYWDVRDGAYFLSSQRNAVRLPAYSRLDVRANRTFLTGRTRMTAFVEVTNVYNRNNVRALSDPTIDPQTLRANMQFEPLTPLVPAVGCLIEF